MPCPDISTLVIRSKAALSPILDCPGPLVCDFLSRETSRQLFAEGTTFQIAPIEMVANTGTHVDAPIHRFDDGADLTSLELKRLADLDGVVIDATDKG